MEYATFEDVRIIKETDKALLLELDDEGKQVWVPKSVIGNYDDEWNEGYIVDVEIRMSFVRNNDLC